MRKKQTVGVDSEDEFDVYDEMAEANCELAVVEGQLCSIPYELYDLPDLMGMLSVETWNSSLTEEERLFLSCFLPDMDQETFSVTMKELLGGDNLYFGNPVDKFYKKLRGGLFVPKVACCKEGVLFVKRKIYYYYLKFYHEKMIKTFTEMKRLWDQYGKELGNKARVFLWSERTQNRNFKRIDLNRVPFEGMDGASRRLANLNVVRSVERNRAKSLNFPSSGGSKSSLKFKITNNGVHYHGSSLASSGDHHHHHQTLPKGLLKVLPKSSSAIFGEPFVSPENNLLKIHETSSKSSRVAASPYAGVRFVNPYGTLASSNTELPKCSFNYQDSFSPYLETAQRSSIDRICPVLHDPTRSTLRGLGTSNYSYTGYTLPTKQEEYVDYQLTSPGLKPRFVDRSTETMEKKRILSGRRFQRNANVVREQLYVLSEENHAQDTNDDHLYSLTYKRRKVQRIGFT